jgi:hypothetical protein
VVTDRSLVWIFDMSVGWIKLLDWLVDSVSIGHNSLRTGAQMIWLQSVLFSVCNFV